MLYSCIQNYLELPLVLLISLYHHLSILLKTSRDYQEKPLKYALNRKQYPPTQKLRKVSDMI